MNSKNNKGIKIVGGTLLTLAIVALLSITYANYTATLQITGAGTASGAKWEIKFEDQPVTTEKHSTEVGYEKDVQVGEASADGTTLRISNATLKRPGDNIIYTFKVQNNGDFDAILDTVTPTIKCEENGAENQSDQTSTCKSHIVVSLLDSQNSTLATTDGSSANYENKEDKHKLLHENSTEETFKLKIEYKNDTTQNAAGLLNSDIKITEFGATLTYKQYTAQ